MLTRGLEEAIQKGIAVYRTFVFGGSGVSTIPCPTKKFIIITDFTYFPFVDFTPNNEPEELFRRSVFQLEFRSEKSQNHYIIRNGLLLGKDSPFFGFAGLSPIKFDTYLVHQDNVQIDIVNVPSTEGWATTYAKLPPISQESPQPMGYGQTPGGEDAVRKIVFSAGEEYLPLTHLRDDIVSASAKEQFKVNVNATNKLNDVSKTLQGNYGYPIVNIGYVEFSRNPNEFVKASN